MCAYAPPCQAKKVRLVEYRYLIISIQHKSDYHHQQLMCVKYSFKSYSCNKDTKPSAVFSCKLAQCISLKSMLQSAPVHAIFM